MFIVYGVLLAILVAVLLWAFFVAPALLANRAY